MSSLTGQSSSTKSLTGLSDTYSTNIVCDTLEVADEFTCDPGCVITLPPASIQDSYLTSNVAFRNQVNNFTLANNFASTTTHNGTTTNNGTSNFNSTMNVNNGTIQNFFSTGATSNSRIQQTASGLQLVNGTSSQSIGLYTRTSGGVVGANLICQNGNTCYMQGDAANRIQVTASITPTLTIQAPLSSNNLSIVNSAWVVSQAFAKLAGPQTFTGDHNFPTQLTTDNSTLVATTAYVKNQGYATTASLSAYALLAPPSGQTFTGLNNFPTQATSDNSTLVATTAYVKNNLLDYGRLTLSTGATLQTWFGSNRFSSNSTNLPISLQNTDAPTHGGGMFIASGNGQFNPNVLQNDTVLLSTGTGSGTGSLCITTWSGTSVGIRIGSNIVVYNGATHNFNGTNNNFNGSVSLGLVGSTISLVGICSFTNTTTPVITQSISLADNSTKIATTAFVKGQNYITSSALTPYALLNPSTTQTFAGTGDNVFSNIVTCTSGLNSNSNITLFSGALSSNIRQNTLGLEITNVDLSKYIQLITRTPGGGNTIGVSCANGNSAYIQGDTGAQISITNQQANIGGSAPPTISTNPFNSDNSNKIASTSFVKNQGYAILNPPALQTWGTNQNQFNTQINMNSTPIRFVDGFSSQISQSGNALIIKNISNVNSVQIRSTTAGLVERTGVTVQNGNETIIQGGSAGIIRVLGNNATIESTTFTSNAPYTCGYNTLGTLPTKTNNDIGYVWSVPGSSFTSWNGFVTANNVYTLAWDGTGDKTIGVWKVDISVTTNSATTINTNINWNTTSTTSMTPNFTCANSVGVTTHGSVSCNILRLNFTLDVTNLTTTYYLNFLRASGTVLSDNTGASRIEFCRIA